MNTHRLSTAALLGVGLIALEPALAGPVIGSSTYEGRTTVVSRNADGTHTVSVTGPDGKTIAFVPKNPPPGPGISVDDGNGGFKRYVPPARSPEIGSSTFEGQRTVVTRNNDGSHTVTVTDRTGRTTSFTPQKPPPGISVDDGNGGWKPYVSGMGR